MSIRLPIRTIKKIAELIKMGMSDSYIQAVIWGMRDNDTAMNDINLAIDILRKSIQEQEDYK